MILDFDLHHGNGTADIFADDSSVSRRWRPWL